jgi:hypothetical protein
MKQASGHFIFLEDAVEKMLYNGGDVFKKESDAQHSRNNYLYKIAAASGVDIQ